MMTEFSIIIPCYNERNAISITLDQIINSIHHANFEIIVVDDGSTDGTLDILKIEEIERPNLTVVMHHTNKGYGAALKTGIKAANSDTIVITDADGTYPNHRIPELVDEAKGFDMLVGARVGDDVDYSKVRAIPKIFLRTWASQIAGTNIPDINSGLRVFHRPSVEHFFPILPNTFSFTTTITLCMLTNYRAVKYVPISYKQRIGNSKIRPIRDTLRFCMLILRTGMYFAPIRLLMPLIIILVLLSIGSFVYDVFIIGNISDKTTLIITSTFNSIILALLADMIDKRSIR